MNKLVLVLAAAALFAAGAFVFQAKSNDEISRAFAKFTRIHGRNYNNEERAYRMQVFTDNFYRVQQMNQMNDGATYELNKFADLTAAEFKAIYLGYKQDKPLLGVQTIPVKNASAIDWSAKGAVQAVKDQGQCGSCWAFSAVGSMESEAAVHGSGLANLAEQQLVDCSRSYGNYGCNGGLMDYAFEYAIDHGMVNESDYKYTARDGTCKVQSGDFHISKYTDVPSGNCDSLASAIQNQPISVAVDAESWQFYSGGVFSNCGKSLDHGVLLVGIDDSGVWKIKNSWGTSWGEKGFIRLASGATCGICLAASWPSQ